MPFHTAGFLESLDPAGVFVNVAAIQDGVIFSQADDLRTPELNALALLAGGAENAVAPRLRLTTPTLDQQTNYEIAPLNVATAAGVEPGSPAALMDLRRTPIRVGVDELMRAELNSNPAAAQIQWALAWFADGPIAPVESGDFFTVRGTGATAQGVGAWTSVPITLDENLAPGRYAVVGLRPEAATCIAARFVSRDQVWRPGALGADAVSDLTHEIFRYGQLGIWTEFPFTQFPEIEFLSVAADAAQIVHVDLLQVG